MASQSLSPRLRFEANNPDEISSSNELNTTISVLQADKFRFALNIDGPRLLKFGVFILTLAAKTAFASIPRDGRTLPRIVLSSDESVGLEIRPSDNPQRESPGFTYHQGIWMLWKAANRLLEQKTYAQWTFTLAVGTRYLATGNSKKAYSLAEAAVDTA